MGGNGNQAPAGMHGYREQGRSAIEFIKRPDGKPAKKERAC